MSDFAYYHPTLAPNYFRAGDGFTLDGNQYPRGWLRQNPMAASALGFQAVTYSNARPDDGWYVVTENRSGAIITYTGAPKDIATLRAKQKGVNSAACRSAIYGGFSSAALGSPHYYPTLDKDQTNMIGAYSASLAPGLPVDWTVPFWCTPDVTLATGWDFRLHTAAQIQQAFQDGVTAKVALLTRNATFAAHLDALAPSASVADVQAIKW